MHTREDYDRAFALLRDLINEWDPYALIESGSPPDEYDQEVGLLLPKLNRVKSEDDAALAVAEAFSEAYAEKSELERMFQEAGRIIYRRFLEEGLLS